MLDDAGWSHNLERTGSEWTVGTHDCSTRAASRSPEVNLDIQESDDGSGLGLGVLAEWLRVGFSE